MAPLPDNGTPRLYIDYTSGGQRHTMDIRLAAGSTTADAVSAYAAIVPAMVDLMPLTDSVVGARFSASGSNLSFPLPVASEAGTNVDVPDPDNKPSFVSVTGRDALGRRVRVTFFSAYFDTSAYGFRLDNPTGLEAALHNAITGATVDARTISGAVPVWNPYLNVGSNAYFQRKARRT